MLWLLDICLRYVQHLHGQTNTLCACAVRNNGIMAISTRGKFWTRAGDEKLMINK